MSEKLLWWGYKHANGSYQTKRFWDKIELEEAHESPFCEIVVEPFEASGRDEALEIVKNKTNNI
ncbi:MAG: hypothetical protein LBE82_11740 [Chitinophagaceae bacterium]|jgi:hypothetical protein|nr:hypothetical protein [Chitinophagaceae bacterium]